MLRTALLPFDAFVDWSDALEAPASLEDAARLEQALRADRERLRKQLSEIVVRPEIREALFHASADLDAAVGQWLQKPDSKKSQRVERTLVRYFSRMCGRATPFGLFAGHSVGLIGQKTRLEVDPLHRYQRHTRLDMDYLGSLIEILAADPELQKELIYRPNSSLHRSAGRLRYAESRLEKKARSYHLVAVDDTPYLLETLRLAEKGATVAKLAEALVGDEVSLDDATGYVRELVHTQLLVPDLAPKATGPEPIHDLISQLRPHSSAGVVADRLEEIRKALETIDSEPLGMDVERYKEIAVLLEKLPAQVEIASMLQVDMFKPAPGATLGAAVLEEIALAVRELHGLRADSPDETLTSFREAFRARYENREMPLLDVLDEESGIGFGASRDTAAEASPLLAGLVFPPAGARSAEGRVAWGPLDTFLLNKLTDLARTDSQVMNLEREELARFRRKEPDPLPDSLSVVAKLAAGSQESLEQGDFKILLSTVSGPSGANLLGRFCHGDAQLLDYVKRHLRSEEALRPDVVFAEIVHLPEGRSGNITLRPTIREHEIPYLGRSAVHESRQIPTSDLMVSLRGQTVVLRSRRLGKEVVPRLTSAHNTRRSGLGIYRFLCAVQYQGVARGLFWNWGALEGSRFLPRVVVGRAVLARARWLVERLELKAAIDSSDADRYRLVQEWRQGRRIPRLVLLVDGDNKLAFDLDNMLSVDTLVELVKKRSQFRLEEFYPGPGELCATGPEGGFVHELVVPLLRKREVATAPRRAPSPAVTTIQRSFPPGSEWLYIKLYTGNAGADQVLRDAIAPLVRQVLNDGSAGGWFFIRYADPDGHLRIRFHGDPRRLSGDVLPRLHLAVAPLVEDGVIWKIQLDTYEREIERYGEGEAMLLAERLFQLDSEATLDVLESFSGDEFAGARWQLTVRGMDEMLDDLGFDLEKKHSVVSSYQTSLFDEMRVHSSFRHQFGDRFRRERKGLETLLDRANDETSSMARGLGAFRTRSRKLREVTARLREISAPLESLAGSYLHMHANRMLRSAQKSQELVIYDFLTRLYESQRAKARRSSGGLP